MKDTAIEKTELVMNALNYAYKHNLNIDNSNDVKKILEAVQIESEDIDEFKYLLQNADTFIEMMAVEKEAKKTDLPS